MINFPNIDPVIVHVWGPFAIRWYGLMYLVALLGAWLFIKQQTKPSPLWSTDKVTDLIFYAAVGMVVGGRLGYMCFYDLDNWLSDLSRVFRVWEGGMSFHGGFIGVFLGLYYFSTKNKIPFLSVIDIAASIAPFGIGAGRAANFINGELYGNVTTVPWGMVFPHAGELPRHPSQLYEVALEGILLLIILQMVYRSKHRSGTVAAGFLIGYGLCRIFIEFFRQPDVQYGYLAFEWLTMGQILSLPMVIAGLVLWIFVHKINTPYSKGSLPCVNT